MDFDVSFRVGQQPCQNFRAQRERNGYAEWSNRHECYCGHAKRNGCSLSVSFCENCSRDHHENGYEACICGGAGFDKGPEITPVES